MARHKVQSAQERTAWRVAITAAVVIVLVCAYIAADALGVAPGFLSVSGQSAAIPAEQSAVKPGAIVSAVSDKAPAPNKAAIEKALNELTSNPAIGKDISVIVANQNGSKIVSVNPTTPREPASTLKTLTALAAVTDLDMNSTLNTTVYAENEAGGSATLVLRGGGDMLLSAGLSDPNHVNGRAGLQTLANETAAALKKRGVTKVNVVYDDSLFGTDRTPKTMAPTASGDGYFTPTSAMAIDQGKQWSAADPADSNPDSEKRAYAPRNPNPVPAVAQTFATELAGDGIGVTGGQNQASKNQIANEKQQIAVIKSAPLWQILRFTLEQSDNTLAEEFGRLVALKEHTANTPEGAVKAVMATDKRLGIDLAGVHMADCCGLSSGSLMTATALIQVQEKLYNSADAAGLEGLAVAGYAGTALARHFTADSYGLVRIKTGSLPHTTAMAGSVLRKKGGLVFFSILVNNPANFYEATVAIDTFVSSLVDC